MDAILEATARDTFGKNEARRTRAAGHVPAIVYGASAAGEARTATPISVEPKALLKILHSESGANTLISLKLAGTADAKVLVKDYQLDPITHQIGRLFRFAERSCADVSEGRCVHAIKRHPRRRGLPSRY